MKLKKALSLVLTLCLCLSLFAIAFTSGAEDAGKLKFHEDGTFKILMMNDTQDDQNMISKTESFIKKALEQEKPDLVVVAGDILSDIWPFCTTEKLYENINNICTLFQNAGVPFALTMGNHDHDRIDECEITVADIMNVAKKYSCHVSTADGCDAATYSIPVYSSDGTQVKYVVYMCDSNNKGEALSMSGYTGLTKAQIDWYKSTAEKYREANGGEYVNSTVIQHVPVAEIYSFLTKVDINDFLDDDVVYSTNDKNWYRLNTADYPDLTGSMGEAPCSEMTSTGEYQAWVETGVVSAFFAHDHVNNFAATTTDGIYMGYNGGTGFNSYGVGDTRSMRVINVDENDTAKSDTHLIWYGDVTGDTFSFYLKDVITPTIVTKLMKILYSLPSLFMKFFKGL